MEVKLVNLGVKYLIINVLISFFLSCTPTQKKLPILGFREVGPQGDTLYHQIPDFTFTDQDGNLISQETTAGKIYITDFFFTSCPTICPKMKAQMLRIHDAFIDNEAIVLLSHTIDPAHDSVAVLKEYASRLGIQTAKWHLLTGEKDVIYGIAEKYLVSVAEDDQEPGGFIHGGHFILIDTDRHIRGYYDGTKEEEVSKLIEDIRLLLNERQTQ